MTLPGLDMHEVTIEERADTVDSEGTPTGTWSQVWAGRGTWGSPTTRDIERAAQQGQVLDAVLALPSNATANLGDRANVRGSAWRIVGVMDVRIHKRLMLQRSE